MSLPYFKAVHVCPTLAQVLSTSLSSLLHLKVLTAEEEEEMEEEAMLEQELLAKISVDQVKRIIQSVYDEMARDLEVSSLKERRSTIPVVISVYPSIWPSSLYPFICLSSLSINLVVITVSICQSSLYPST